MKNNLQILLLVVISSVLFAFANPGFLIKDGFWILGWVYYIPVLWFVSKASLKNVFFFGGLYGALSYSLYCFWLKNFHPLGLLIICILYFLILGAVCFLLKYAEVIFKRSAFYVQFLILCSYEFVKTLGYAGFGYGVTAYTQWKNLPVIQVASEIGIFGLNAILIFSSVLLFQIFVKSCKKIRVPVQIYLSVLFGSLIFGICSLKEYSQPGIKSIEVGAIQNNENPWKNGIEEYILNVDNLIELTDQLLSENPEIELVVWPETAVVPAIKYHYYNNVEPQRNALVNRLLEYIEKSNVSFVIGNNNQQIAEIDAFKRIARIEYFNSALYFEKGKTVIPPSPEVYSKIHLVPFTESFPWKKQFPKLYKRLLNGDTHMWDAGKEYSVFNCGEVSFGTPICFEDTFSDGCRKFVKNGAKAFVNLSNDSWSASLACQKQHLAMAVFRSVENRVPSVRSTSSGQTCIVDATGKIVVEAEPFCKSFVCGKLNIPENAGNSLYVKIRDVFGYVELALAFALLILKSFVVIMKIRWNNER